MRFTEIELQSEDILWFAIDNQNHIIAFTSGGAGCIPEFVCNNKEITAILEEFFLEKFLPTIELSQKGIYCFDVNYDDNYGDSYTKVDSPSIPIDINVLPSEVQKLLINNKIDIDASTTEVIKIKHAY